LTPIWKAGAGGLAQLPEHPSLPAAFGFTMLIKNRGLTEQKKRKEFLGGEGKK
jgi:hypothetical protein